MLFQTHVIVTNEFYISNIVSQWINITHRKEGRNFQAMQ